MADTTDETSGVVIDEDKGAATAASDVKPVADIDVKQTTGDALDALLPSDEAPATKNPKQVSSEDADEESASADENDNRRRTVEQENKTSAADALDAAIKKQQDAADTEDKTVEEAESEEVDPTKEAGKKTAEPEDSLSKEKLPNVSKSAAEAFDNVKRIAREEIGALKQQLAELKEKVPEGVEVLTPELKSEIEKLREFQKAHGYVSSAEFKSEYVAPLEDTEKRIETKLKSAGMSDEQIASAKKIGFDKLDWDEVYKAVPAPTRHSLSALLLQREQQAEKKNSALEAAKDAPAQYAAKQEEASKKQKAEEEATVKAATDQILANVDWFSDKPVPADANDEKRLAIEADNTFAKEQKQRLDGILKDRSPAMFGTLAAATIAAHQYKRDLTNYKERAERAEAQLSKIRKASTTARATRAAKTTAPDPTDSGILIDGNAALDAHRKSIEASRA